MRDGGEPGRRGDVAAAAHHGVGAAGAQQPAGGADRDGRAAERDGGAAAGCLRSIPRTREEVDLVAGRGDELRLGPLARADEADLGARSASASATASAGTTCPAVPPAAITTRGTGTSAVR